MKFGLMAVVLVAVALLSLNIAGAASDIHDSESAINVVPASLDSLYPPHSPTPKYLLAMMNLGEQLSCTVCDILENDLENARGNFELFKKSYLEVSKMVPEWKHQYPSQPIDNLGVAIAGGDPAKIMPAVDEMGEVCHRCHVAFMPPIQQKHCWNDFADVTLSDPLTGKNISFAGIMIMMETNFTGIGSDVKQGQIQNAQNQLGGFSARFQAMTAACMTCHDTERKYFVDESVTKFITDLQSELGKPQVDAAAVGGLLESIGKESCSKCHLVHIPAAYSQQMMKGHE